jgi:glycosyltransferase involved in cell wall biosynthesis
MIRVAIINLTSGGLSGGNVKTMTNLVPLLRNEPCVSASEVFVPKAVLQLPLLKTKNLRTWPEQDWMSGYFCLKKQIQKFAPDVIFIPTAVSLNFKDIPTVVMIRNMEALAKPFGGNSFRVGIKNLLRRYMAKTVIAVSDFVKEFLVNKYNIPTYKIDTIYHGVNPPPAPQSTVRPEVPGWQDEQPFLFTAGSLVFYRGLQDIIRTMVLLKNKSLPHKLLVAGASLNGTSKYEKHMKQLADKNGIASRIVWLGQLSPEEMSWCFYHCEAFIMTSRLEACPNLALEALSHGCINISTATPPMPEIFDKEAMYYRAGYPKELVNQIINVTNLKPEQEKYMQNAARARANIFSWPTTVERIIQVLQKSIVDNRKTYSNKKEIVV